MILVALPSEQQQQRPEHEEGSGVPSGEGGLRCFHVENNVTYLTGLADYFLVDRGSNG